MYAFMKTGIRYTVQRVLVISCNKTLVVYVRVKFHLVLCCFAAVSCAYALSACWLLLFGRLVGWLVESIMKKKKKWKFSLEKCIYFWITSSYSVNGFYLWWIHIQWDFRYCFRFGCSNKRVVMHRMSVDIPLLHILSEYVFAIRKREVKRIC